MLCTKDNFCSTCHRGEECLFKILQKPTDLNIYQQMEPNKATDSKLQYKCQQKGHKMWTCAQACKHCGHTPYCGHLVKSLSSKGAQCQIENEV